MDLHIFTERNIKLELGNERVKLYVPEKLLRDNESLFDTDLVASWNGEWPDTIAMRSADPQAWADVLYWLSLDKFTRLHRSNVDNVEQTTSAAEKDPSESMVQYEQNILQRYIEAYELAHEAGFEKMQNEIMTATSDFLERSIHGGHITMLKVYGFSRSSSLLIHDKVRSVARRAFLRGQLDLDDFEASNLRMRKWSKEEIALFIKQTGLMLRQRPFDVDVVDEQETCDKYHKHRVTVACNIAKISDRFEGTEVLEAFAHENRFPQKANIITGDDRNLYTGKARAGDAEVIEQESEKAAPASPRIAWDAGLSSIQRKRKEKGMRLDGIWEDRITQEMIDAEEAAAAALAAEKAVAITDEALLTSCSFSSFEPCFTPQSSNGESPKTFTITESQLRRILTLSDESLESRIEHLERMSLT